MKGKGISAMLAVKMFDCYRLGARIFDLRNRGHNIKTTMVEHNKKRFALYTLEE
jgi:hypothetical protein